MSAQKRASLLSGIAGVAFFVAALVMFLNGETGLTAAFTAVGAALIAVSAGNANHGGEADARR